MFDWSLKSIKIEIKFSLNERISERIADNEKVLAMAGQKMNFSSILGSKVADAFSMKLNYTKKLK